MPELPEVETVRRQLLDWCRNEKIVQSVISAPGLLQNCDAELFNAAVQGTSIQAIDRKGKYLIFTCGSWYPVFHLGMSGIFLTDAGRSKFPQHIHVKFKFASGKPLYFQDVRRFGKIWLYDQAPALKNLGIDPVNQPLDIELLDGLIGNRNTAIKLFLMDQQHIAGIGNIYASEILFAAGISPYRQVSTVNNRERHQLIEAINKILSAAIENFGTTYTAYQTVSGESGNNQKFLQVYQREGLPCSRCGTSITKSIQGSRSTFYCQQCQK